MFTLSNSLSFLRIPLAFVFLLESPAFRLAAIALAMISDSVDGYLARRSKSVSRLGAVLDPTTDKFFVYFALVVLFAEGKILAWQVVLMLSRDICLCLYGLFMLITGRMREIVFRAIRWGKATTALQFLVLIGLSLQFSFSGMTYSAFMAMGGFALIELFQTTKRSSEI